MFNNNSILFKRKKLFSEPVIEQPLPPSPLNTQQPQIPPLTIPQIEQKEKQSDIITILLIILKEYSDIFWYLFLVIVLNLAVKTVLLVKKEFFDAP